MSHAIPSNGALLIKLIFEKKFLGGELLSDHNPHFVHRSNAEFNILHCDIGVNINCVHLYTIGHLSKITFSISLSTTFAVFGMWPDCFCNF